MNIFYLDPDAYLAAQMLYDKHVVKQGIECAQILSTAIHLSGLPVPEGLYRATHRNHPCVKWALESTGNFAWTMNHGVGILEEFTRRYGKPHATMIVLNRLQDWAGKRLKWQPATPPPQVMPEEFQEPDTVEAYRNYYRTAKAYMMRYTNREPPTWLN
jgi:hypothetical protein